MLFRSFIWLLSLGVSANAADTYLVLPDVPSALARSEDQCLTLKCNDTTTKYWWPVITLKDGTAAVIIKDAGPFSKSTSVDGKLGALTAQEDASRKTKEDLKAVWPDPLPGIVDPIIVDQGAEVKPNGN